VGHLKTGIHRESLGETYFKETFYLWENISNLILFGILQTSLIISIILFDLVIWQRIMMEGVNSTMTNCEKFCKKIALQNQHPHNHLLGWSIFNIESAICLKDDLIFNL
jgi:hypothetical protein